ncbi:SAM-dependent methyltransferase [Streptomyces antioxidans]|uniref:SAM-dependent methyltransferase n=1 Tax=Streptomyces antioxidans TaxID=1507734 RepID=A0A1V4D924_9ACTN|nr:class I SAM-dependent methyltransferase [Streptomyces antioxidans]OPF81410.1 SAM-dependent methyltransferase [Streptomyces antioxidans]
MTNDADLRRRRASSFGTAAATYTEHRPGYPEAAVAWALEPVAGRGTLNVLDLGAGTGLLTQDLLRAGARVTAVEPDEQMLAELRRRLPKVPTYAGSAEEIPLPDGSVDAVLAGQAFHWFDQDRALPEIARVLRPGGVVAGLWNTYDDQAAWVVELGRLAPIYVGREGELTMVGHPAYEPVEAGEFAHAMPRSAESLTATLATHSSILVLPQDEQERLLSGVRAYLDSHPETGDGRTFDFPLVTVAERAVRR